MKLYYNYGNRSRKIITIIMAIIYTILSIILVAQNRTGQIVYMGQISVSGVMTAVQFGVSLLMASVEYEVGGMLALVLTAISFVMSSATVAFTGNLSIVPGLCYYAVSFIAIIFIRNRISRERKNAFTDDLTGISNRKNILENIKYYISLKTPFYIIFLDLNNFKLVNDTQGHEKGDSLIQELVKKWCTIDDKNVSLGRFGGDEFIAIIKKSKCNDKDIETLTQEYIDVVADIAQSSESLYSYLSISAGIVEYPVNGKNADELLRKVAITAEKARNEDRNQLAMYHDMFEEEVLREHYIESRIENALEKKLFYMVYQPQYETGTKKLRGFESLIRMRAEGDEQMLYPGEFIPVAEKSDLIIRIGEYVIENVMEDFAPLFIGKKDMIVTINISAKQLLSRNFVGALENSLAITGFRPENLEIEITEYCFIDTTREVFDVINRLKDLGIKIAMDDFGTGYSSFSYLIKLPIDILKIDKSIIDEIGDGEIVRAICYMGHELSCEIIAEGVEEEKQLDVLKDLGCDYIQGYIWGKPVRFESAQELVLKQAIET